MSKRMCAKRTSFERLPEILIFQLQRAQFDRSHKKAFKLHDTFKFYDTINVDRFMIQNSSSCEEKRTQVLEWESQKRKLEKN